MDTACLMRVTSPLQLAARLIQVAQDAADAGFGTAAKVMVGLAYAVLEEDASPGRGRALAGSGPCRQPA